MENSIPTAGYLLTTKISMLLGNKIHDSSEWHKIESCMIEFAQLHLDAQAKAICENVTASHVECYGQRTGEIEIDKDSILNAYPKTNVK